jgi:branched-chain amino acid transport system substrate-binding protein
MFLNSSWSTSLKTHFVAEYEHLGGRIVATESADVDTTDFRSQLIRLGGSKPKAIVALLYAKEGGRFVKQARELGMTTPFFGGDPWTIKDFLDIAGQAADGVRFTTPANYEGAEAQAFRKKFVERFGSEPDVYAAHGYDAAKLIAAVMKQGAFTGPAIRQAFLSLNNFQGATGVTTFDDHGDVTTKPFARMTVRAGQVVPYQPN